MKTLATLAGTVFLGVIALNVCYAADDAPRSRTVQFADLDPSKVEGAAALYRRIKAAAEAVCDMHSDGKRLVDKQRYTACIELALANAVTRVDEPALTGYVVTRTTSGQKASPQVASSR